MEEFDVLIHIFGEYNSTSLSNIDPNRISYRTKAYSEVIKTYFERTSSKDLRRVVTNYPNQAFAQDANMSLEEYADFLYSVTFADCEDPVSKWEEINAEQQRRID